MATKVKLALMVGHGVSSDGSWDPGCAYNGYTEAKLAYDIVGEALTYLKNVKDLELISDYYAGNDRNMYASVAWANSQKCTHYIVVHVDYSGAPAGVYPYYISSAGKTMASAMLKVLKSDLKMASASCIKTADFYELTGTNMPAVLLESGSIKNDLEKLKDYKTYGKALAKAVCSAVGVTFVDKAATVTTTTTTKKITAPKTLEVDGYFGPLSIAKAGEWAGVTTLADKFAGQMTSMKSYIPGILEYCTWTGKGSATVKAIQKKIGAEADGIIGPDTVKKLQTYLNKYNFYLTVDGVWGSSTSTAFQRFLNNDIPAKKTTTTTTTTSGAKNRIAKFNARLDSMGKEMINSGFKYRNSSSNKSTYASAKKSAKYANCADYVSWALQDAGVLPSGKKIWLNAKINGSGKSSLKHVKIMYVNAYPSKCNLQPGDIVGFSSGPHTMVYRGKSGSTMKWSSAGGSDFSAKNLWNRTKSSYDKKKVRVIIRITS